MPKNPKTKPAAARPDLPAFDNEEQERAFWQEHDSAEYLDWSQAKPAQFPNLKPTSRTISLRLPLSLLTGLRILANQRDVPYQSLLKIYLAERVAQEFGQVGEPADARGKTPPRRGAQAR
jgi:predicted DNA binding CopG/RHH family protein